MELMEAVPKLNADQLALGLSSGQQSAFSSENVPGVRD